MLRTVMVVSVVMVLVRGQALNNEYLPPPLGYLPPPVGHYLPPPGREVPSFDGSFDPGFGLPLPNLPSTSATRRPSSTTASAPPTTSAATRRPSTSAATRYPSTSAATRRPGATIAVTGFVSSSRPAPAASSRPKVIFFEDEHYANKATEPGFCNTFCGSIRDTIVQKPGRCPAVKPGPPRGTCKDECTYDSECPGKERCCDSGCSRVCVVPDFRRTCEETNCGSGTACVEYADRDAECVATAPKPGLCPKYMNNSKPLGGCEDMCRYDAECFGDAKCCSNGCALKCLKPRKPGCAETKCKVGYKCEEDSFGNPQCKQIPCEQDGEVTDIECNSCTCIQGFLLCSQEECPPTKPGFCPRIVKGYKGRCVEECASDYDCADESKCCSTGCGHTCQKPGKAIVHPCKTVRFRCGDDTRCAATRGLCQPGKPCPLSPLCVSNRVPYCESCPEGKVCVLQKKACFGSGSCHRQPICIQLYSDDTPFEENEDLEIAVVAKQQAARDARLRAPNSIFN